MTEKEMDVMYDGVPKNLFRVHKWRSDLTTLGEVPSEFMREVSEGKVNYKWPAQVNRFLQDGGHDLILSIGQVVPHEVVGMANYNKNIFVGTGGQEGINKSHFLGAVYGMERMMGRADTPVRRVLIMLQIILLNIFQLFMFIQLLVKTKIINLYVRGLFIGDDFDTFQTGIRSFFEGKFYNGGKTIKKSGRLS